VWQGEVGRESLQGMHNKPNGMFHRWIGFEAVIDTIYVTLLFIMIGRITPKGIFIVFSISPSPLAMG
jgi:hypothetical protein